MEPIRVDDLSTFSPKENISSPTLVETPEANVSKPIRVEDLGSFTPEKVKPRTMDDMIANPEVVNSWRQYLVKRRGEHWLTRSDEEVVDGYTSHQRWVAANEVSTFNEINFIRNADQETLDASSQALQHYESLGNIFQSGDLYDGLTDYVKAAVVAPSTILGVAVGFGLGKAGSTLAAQATLKTAYQAALKQGGKEAAKHFLKSRGGQALIAGAADAAIGANQDWAYQTQIEMPLNVRDEYSLAQGLIVSAVSGAPASAAYMIPEVPLWKGYRNIGEKIDAQQAEKLATASKKAVPKIKQGVKKLAENLIDWRKTVESGQANNNTLKEYLRQTSWFFDIDNPDSLVRSIYDAGGDLANREEGLTKSIISFADALDPADKQAINQEAMKAGFTFQELLDNVAAMESSGGTAMNMASQAARRINTNTVVRQANDSDILKGAKAMLDDKSNIGLVERVKGGEPGKDPHQIKYWTSLWRRNLVAHPATTFLNIKGWGQAQFARTASDAMYGTAKGLATGDWSYTSNLKFKLKSLMDPSASVKEFEELLRFAPQKVKEAIHRETFGGIGAIDQRELFGVPHTWLNEGMERYTNLASKVSLMQVQDTWTKSLSGISELDKQLRLKYKKGLDEVIDAGDYQLLDEDVWMKAMEVAQKDTFSWDYQMDVNNFMGGMAKFTETFSNTPGLGVIFPFGRFVNNNLGFYTQYSPIGFASLASRMAKKGVKGAAADLGGGDRLGEAVAKSMFGTATMAYLMNVAYEGYEEGFTWSQVETDNTQIIDEALQAPGSLFRLSGRIAESFRKTGSIETELWGELADQLGPGGVVQEISGPNAFKDFARFMERDATDEDRDFIHSILSIEVAKHLAGGAADLASGFTRPLDPLNQLASHYEMGNPAQIDRRQAEPGKDAAMQNFTRYVDNIIEGVTGEDIGTPKRSISHEGDIINPSPMGRIGLGEQESQPLSFAKRVLAKVDKPEWLADARTGNPKADHITNDIAAPYFESQAKWLWNSEEFQNSSIQEQRESVNLILNDVKSFVRSHMQEGELGYNPKLEEARRLWLSQPTFYRDRARQEAGISRQDASDSELTMEQLVKLRLFSDMIKEEKRNSLPLLSK